MVVEQNTENDAKIIQINNDMQQLFNEKKIDYDYFKNLYFVLHGNLRILFQKRFHEVFDLHLFIQQGLIEPYIIEIASTSRPVNDITNYAAVGFFFSYLLTEHEDINKIQVFDNTGKGFDFKYMVGDNNNIIEMSGVNVDTKETFEKRISAKRTKLENPEIFDIPIDLISEFNIGVVDFKHKKYTYWDIKKHKNYISRSDEEN